MIVINAKVYQSGLSDAGEFVATWLGEHRVFLAPKLTDNQYGYAVAPEREGGFSVLFVIVRKTGSAEWLSFCDAGKWFEGEAEADAYAAARAAACRYAVDA